MKTVKKMIAGVAFVCLCLVSGVSFAGSGVSQESPESLERVKGRTIITHFACGTYIRVDEPTYEDAIEAYIDIVNTICY